jgi:hypothetical protein
LKTESERGFVIVALCIVGLLIAALLGTLLQVPVVIIVVSICTLLATLTLVRGAALRSLGTTKTLCVLFFSLAAAHMFCGFLAADLTTWHTSIRSNADVYYANALLINAVGLFAAALAYTWNLQRRPTMEYRGFAALVDSDLAEHYFRALLVTGAALMFFVYWRLGLLDYLAQPAKWAVLRYITSDVAGGSATDEWLANRAMDFLTVSLPFLVYRAVKRPRILNVLLIIIGYLALLLPLRRANLLGVLFASLILIGIGRRDVYRLTRRWIFIGAGLYLFSQCVLLAGIVASDFTPEGVLSISSTALPEIRDLAWTLNRLDGEKLKGVTFVQALIPLPSISNDWSAKHSLRAISTRLIGADNTGESGGLRLTIMGEGYINFGYFGAMLAGFLWGWGVACCERLLLLIETVHSEFMNYVAVMCFVWLCFLIYLAGTQSAAFVKMGALLVLGIAWICRYRPRLVAQQGAAA